MQRRVQGNDGGFVGEGTREVEGRTDGAGDRDAVHLGDLVVGEPGHVGVEQVADVVPGPRTAGHVHAVQGHIPQREPV